MSEFIVVELIIFTSAFIQGVAGFGNALVAVPLLAMLLDIKTIIPLIALNGLVIGVTLFLRLRERLDIKAALPLIISSLPAIPLGVYFMKSMDAGLIKAALSIMLTSYSAWALIGGKINFRLNEKFGYIFGFVSGLMGGAFSINGPVAILYALTQPWDIDKMKITLTTYFLISNIAIVFFHITTGVTTWDVAGYFAWGAPLLITGTLAGLAVYDRIDRRTAAKVVYVMIFVTGLMLFPR